MSNNDEPMKAGYNLTRKRVDIVQAHADANYDGNASLALRKIIDEWKQMKDAHPHIGDTTISQQEEDRRIYCYMQDQATR